MHPTQIIIKPVISEKSYALAAVGKYVFRVHTNATKVDIKHAVESLFDVQVRSVKTLSVKGKPKRRGLIKGRRRSWKKAVVEVADGQSLPVFEAFEGLEGEL